MLTITMASLADGDSPVIYIDVLNVENQSIFDKVTVIRRVTFLLQSKLPTFGKLRINFA